MRPFYGLGSVVLLLAGLVACSSEKDPPASTGPDPDAAGPSREEVLASCAAFAEKLCASASECCAMAAPGSTVDACVELVMRETCRPAADAVAAKLATYHPEAEPACLEAHARSHQTCVADWGELIELRRAIWGACRVVRGTLSPGRSCTTAATCAVPDETIGTARCVAGTCRVVEILGEGAACPYPNGDVSVCDTGLYCTARERDEIGTCRRVVELDGKCEPVKLNPECGLGSFCDLKTGRCKLADNFGGPSCAQGTECVSFLCDPVKKECEEPKPTVAALCAAE
jgi:hypothetical protein